MTDEERKLVQEYFVLINQLWNPDLDLATGSQEEAIWTRLDEIIAALPEEVKNEAKIGVKRNLY